MKRKTFILAILACMCFALQAQEYLTLYARSGLPTQSWEVSKVRRITFSPTNVTFWMKQGGASYTYAYSAARRIAFGDEDPIAVKSLALPQQSSIMYDADRNAVIVNDFAQGGQLQVYSIGGSRVWAAPVRSLQREYQLPPLPDGIYIVRLSGTANPQSIKFKTNKH